MLKALVYIQSRDERSQVRPFLGKVVPDIVMVNSAQELLSELKSNKSFDLLILDDSFDAKSPDGENLFEGPSIPEILQEIQAGFTDSSDATILTVLRPVASQNGQGTVTDFVDVSVQDREHLYTELGSSLFLKKPFTTATLNLRMAELVKASMTPPVWIKALKQVRQLYAKKLYSDVLVLLDRLAEHGFEQKQIGFSLLRAKCLTQIGGESGPAAHQLLLCLRESSPQSLSVRMLLLESHLRLGQLHEAFAEQLGIFSSQKTAFNFDKALLLMSDAFESKQKSAAPEAEAMLVDFAESFLELLKQDPPQYSRKLRPRVLTCVAERIKELSSWARLLVMLRSSEDILTSTADILQTTLEHIEQSLQGGDETYLGVFQEGHALMLSNFPTHPKSIEIVSDTLLKKSDLQSLDPLLKRAELAGAKSLEFYLAMARYFLKLANLKEASDVLHKAVRLKADDIRVLELRQAWQEEYDARNKPVAA